MTQEDKNLLLRDLSSRLPYGVIVRHSDCIVDGEGNETGDFHYTKGYLYDVCREDDMTTTIIESEGENEGYNHICLLEWTIPYLRPMSSITEEEKKDILQSLNIQGDIDNEGNLLLGVECNIITLKVCKKYLGELNKRMFDVCHMIEKGLALESPKGMYEID